MYWSGLQSLVLTGTVLAPTEEALTTPTSLIVQQEAVIAVRAVRTVTSDSGALYICRPEPWFL